MVYYLSQHILDWAHGSDWESRLSFLRLFHYITVRSAGAAVTSLMLSWWFGPKIIRWLKEQKFGQEYADKAEEPGDFKTRILSKKGTPTMGGMLIVLALVFSTMLWAQWNAQVELTMLSVLVLAGLGFYDDYAKILKQSGGGTPPRVKLVAQFALAAFVGIYLWKLPAKSELILLGTRKSEFEIYHSNLVSTLMLPFYKYPLHVGAVVGVVVVVLAIVGSSNAVNLTDGLDGLAIGCTLIVGFVFLVFTYLAGNVKAAAYLQIPYVPGAGELTVFCAALHRRGAGVFVVQLPSGAGVHGRHRVARAGRRVRHHGGADPPAVCAGDRGRRVCGRGAVGDFAEGLVQVYAAADRHRAADFFDGAAAPSF